MEINHSSEVQKLIDKGKTLWEAGDIDGAIRVNEKALIHNSKSENILNNLGILYLQQNRIVKGIGYLKEAIKLSPQSPEAYNNLANYYIRNDELDQASTYLDPILNIEPENITSLRLMGDLKLKSRNYSDAIKYYKSSLQKKIFDAETRTNLGKALLLNKQHDEAKQELRIVLEFNPDFYTARINLATIHYDEFEIDKALKNVDIILQKEPENKIALQHGGVLALNSKRWQKAINYLEKLYNTDTTNMSYCLMLANAYRPNNLLKKSITLFKKAINLEKDNVHALAQLSETYRMKGDFEEAELVNKSLLEIAPNHHRTYDCIALLNKDSENFEVAEENLKLAMQYHINDNEDYTKIESLIDSYIEKPSEQSQNNDLIISNNIAQQHLKLAMFYLYIGNFEKGWIEYQWRFQTQQVIWLKTSKPMWQGEDLKGKKLLIWNEQGLGDTLQFIRYLDVIKDYCESIFVLCQGRLNSLISNSFPFCKIVSGEFEESEYDYHFPLLSLPTIVGCSEKDIPSKIPYLLHDEDFTKSFSQDYKTKNNKLNIGIVWAGNKEFTMDFLRSPQLKAFLPIFDIKNIQFFSFQYGEEKKQMFELELDEKIIDITEYSDGFENDAAIMQALDLVITSDTATVHLAGALGVKTWCVLPFSTDWRWMHKRKDSPWYPSMTLYRQEKPLDWSTPIEKMKLDLKKLILEKNITV